MRNINILGNLLAKDNRELTDEERRLRASLGIKLPSKIHERPVALPPEQTQVMPNNMSQQQSMINPNLLNGLAPETTANRQVTQYGRPVYNKNGESYSEKTITEPINGIFYNIPTVGANGNILNKEQAIQSVIGQDGKITDPITGTPLQGYGNVNAAVNAAESRSQNIKPQIQTKRTVITQNENGTHTRTEEDITPKGSVLSKNFGLNTDKKQYVPDEKNEQELQNIYKKLDEDYESGKLKFGDYLQIAAGAAADAFAIPGTGSNVMQGVLARQAASEDAAYKKYQDQRAELKDRATTLKENEALNYSRFQDQLSNERTEKTTNLENTFTQMQINNLKKQNVDYSTVTLDKEDDGTYTLVGYDKTTNKLVKLGAPTTEQITEYENTQKIAERELTSLDLTNANTRNKIKLNKAKLYNELNPETEYGDIEILYDANTGNQIQVVAGPNGYVDAATKERPTQIIDGVETVVKLVDKDGFKAATQRQKLENTATQYRNSLYNGVGELLQLGTSTFGKWNVAGKMSQRNEDIRIIIDEVFGPEAIKVIGSTTFGSLSAPELAFARSIGNRLLNNRLSKEKAFEELLKFEYLSAKAMGASIEDRQSRFNRDDLRDKAYKLDINPNQSNIELSNAILNKISPGLIKAGNS
jgi:hypothetical protein